MMTYHYSVADFPFTVSLPEGMDSEALLPSFVPFRRAGDSGRRHLFDFLVVPSLPIPGSDESSLLEESYNDMGHLRLYSTPCGYLVEILNGRYTHRMIATSDFSSVRAELQRQDRNMHYALCSMLRVAYAQAVLLHNAISIHAAAIYKCGRAYLFMGTSGTGKSTHASLWMKHLPGSALLNDDNPTIRLVDGRAYAYGTPWSGKTACYKDLGFPIDGMARLRQAPCNQFHIQEGADAFVAIYPGCSIIAQDELLRNRLYDTVASLAGRVIVGVMDCLPDKEAALLCHQALASGK